MKNKASGKKSQLGMSDLFLAASIFVVLMGAAVFAYSHYTSKFESRQEFNRMQLAALEITDMLVKSPGMPSDWELWLDSGEVKLHVIGFAYDPVNARNLSATKIEGFMNMSYTESKKKLGTDYDYYFKIRDLEGNTLAEKGSSQEEGQAAGIERRVLYNNNGAIMSFMLMEQMTS